MTPGEFKAWFDGFTEAFTGCPTKAQWTRIKARVAEIDGKPVTERVYVDRYWPAYRSYTTGGLWPVSNCATTSTANLVAGQNSGIAQAFCSSNAMADLGRAEAKSLAA
jgi:hypothetical protein